ncbi:hypothetical protein KC320_g37 [Hortaea werneckii]|nr:hypothetical protein KC320_g37 [Hortaea werneckii]
MAVRYTIVGLLFAALLLFFVGGYFHARRRLQKGLPPLSYHRWMVGRAYRSYPAETHTPPRQNRRLSTSHRKVRRSADEDGPTAPGATVAPASRP